MPKTTKRAATRRATKVARAHATQLPKLEVKATPQRSPGYRPPARGIARYPVLTAIMVLLIIGLGVYTLYLYHVGPFALPPTKAVTHPHPTATVAPSPTPAPTFAPVNSPCLKLVPKLTDTSPAPTGTAFNAIVHSYSKPPVMSIDANKLYCAGINTTKGLIVLELNPKLALETVNNFVFLAQHQFYDGLKFHRVVAGFVVQTGDPLGTGSGGPGYKFKDEPVKGNYVQFSVAMANSGANTNGSQFFISTADNTGKLQKLYNLFGRVVEGQRMVLAIQGPDPSTPTTQSITSDVMNHVIVVPAS